MPAACPVPLPAAGPRNSDSWSGKVWPRARPGDCCAHAEISRTACRSTQPDTSMYCLWGEKEEEDKLKGQQTSLNYLMKTTKVQTYWWSSQKLCISTLACRNVWQIRGRGCQRSWCSAVGVRSHVGASSAKAQCSYRLRAHGPHTYNRTQSQTRLGDSTTYQLQTTSG